MPLGLMGLRFQWFGSTGRWRISRPLPGHVFGNPEFDQIRQRGGVERTQIQEAVATAMRQEFGGEPGVMSTQAIVFDARKP